MVRAAVFAVAALSIASTVTGQYAPLMEDNTAILNVPGRKDVNPRGWGDSYSVGSSCFCKTNYDHHIDVIPVSTPIGNMTVKQACALLGPGPGSAGRPLYNDVQCGNGPANDAGDEDTCPGRIEYGKDGCKYIGPKWNFTAVKIPTKAPVKAPAKTPTKAPVKAATKTPTKPPVKAATKTPTIAPLSVPVNKPVPPAKAPTKAPVPVSTPVAAPVKSKYAPLLEDNTAILDVPGRKDVNPSGWGDSYSVGSSCFCRTNYDHHIDVIPVSTALGNMTVKQACTLLGPGPGWEGRPRYNDVQCGNGPANDAGDEDTCPGRIEYGKDGCKYVGPKWNFTAVKIPTKAPVKAPTNAPLKAPVKPAPVPITAPDSRPIAPPTPGSVNIFIQASQKSAERFKIVGSTKLNTSPIGTIASGVSGYDANLFNFHRWSSASFSYLISGFLPGSILAMTLGFAETYPLTCATGKRVFNIGINGKTTIANFDTFATAGCKSAHVVTQTVTANATGHVELSFTKIRENPFVSFISIVPV